MHADKRGKETSLGESISVCDRKIDEVGLRAKRISFF